MMPPHQEPKTTQQNDSEGLELVNTDDQRLTRQDPMHKDLAEW